MHRRKTHWHSMTAIAAYAAFAFAVTACGGGSQAAHTTPSAAATRPAAMSTRAATATTAAARATSTAESTVTPSGPEPHATAQTAVPAAAPAPTQPPAPSAAPASPPPPPSGVAATIAAINTLFSPPSLALPAGATVTLTFGNQDDGITHDIVIFDPSGAQIAATELATGPVTQMLTFSLGAPGSYPFKCSVHPQQMRGVISAH